MRLALLDPPRLRRSRFLAVHGQIDDEAGTLTHLRVGEDETTGLFDNPVNRGKPESGAFADLLGREEGFPNLAEYNGGYPRARVGDRERAIVGDREDVGSELGHLVRL